MGWRENKNAAEQEARRYNFIRIWKKRYAHMLARQRGVASTPSNGKGKPICTLEEFLNRCKDFNNLSAFLAIYFEWAQKGFHRYDSPSIDRVDSRKGYTIDNIQWLPFWENCKKHNINPIDRSKEVW